MQTSRSNIRLRGVALNAKLNGAREGADGQRLPLKGRSASSARVVLPRSYLSEEGFSLALPGGRNSSSGVEALIMHWEVSMSRKSVKKDKRASLVPSHIEDLLDEGLEETFPASDSVAVDWIEDKLKAAQHNDALVRRNGRTSRKRGAERRCQMSTRIHATNIKLKRAYQSPARSDGTRVLIDRLWPRGVKKVDLKIDEWMKDISPTTGLRKWFGHESARWPEFRCRYKAELRRHPKELERLRAVARQGQLTLVFAAHDEAHNDAIVVKEMLVGRRLKDGANG